MQLIDKDKVEEILRNLWKEDDGHNPEHRICYNKALQEVQCEIDTLDMKEVQEEPVSEDLENMSYHSAMNLINDPKFLPTTTFGELIPMLQKLYKDGAKWQKEQLIKNKEVKEVDLNEEISKFIETYYSKAKLGHKLSIRRAAAYFYNLGLKAQKGEEI